VNTLPSWVLRRTVQQAVRAHACPDCKADVGRRCRWGGRVAPPHPGRVQLLDADNETAGPCPGRSPESDVPCGLPDTRAMHYFGHSGPHPSGDASGSVGWATSDADRTRWETPA
jgi:hypothetical protein